VVQCDLVMVVEHVEPEARNPKRHDQQAKSPFLPRGYVEAHQEMAETLSQSGPDRVPPRATLHAGRTRFSHIASFPLKLAVAAGASLPANTSPDN
jgi:hypothetical protein